MHNFSKWLACLLASALIVSTPIAAQDEPAGPTTRERVEIELEDIRQRLDLPDYTWNQVHLILKTSIRERIAIAQKYGLEEAASGEALSSKDERRMRKELKHSRKTTAERMERYLDKQQMKTFKALQDEIDTKLLAG